MKSIHIFSIFVVVVLAQLFVPAQMILDQENTIARGTAYKFRTQPVDPSDPFKGKYIYLNYDISFAATNDTTWVTNAPIYITFKTDSLGFAMVKDVSKDDPKAGDYLKTKVTWYNRFDNSVGFSFPFNEFYMNETKAYDAELAHAQAQRDSLPNNTYALVYVLKGKAVLDNVFINDIPIADYVEKE
ncbi:GDYXXLXY domain-containing protein [Gelidibacter sp.]|uniref:GDYXXLXY domain-containing protein n=1 Tax=Gelidibacter sp. TaxID=2018083 RepID=UPI003267BEF6